MGERRPDARQRTSAQPGLTGDPPPTGPSDPPARRPGRGTLAGRLTLSGDWDSTATNEEIAEDFYR